MLGLDDCLGLEYIEDKKKFLRVSEVLWLSVDGNRVIRVREVGRERGGVWMVLVLGVWT